VQSELGTLGGAPVQDGLFLMIACIVDNQMPATVGGAGTEGTQEVTTLQVGMPLIALGQDGPRPDLTGGAESDGAMADLLKLLVFDQPRRQGQGGVLTRQGLDVGRLIEAEHPTAPGRRQVELTKLGPLLLQQGGGPGQARAPAMRFQNQFRHTPLHGRRTQGQTLSAPGAHPRQIPDAGGRQAPKLPLLRSLAGDGDDRVPRQRGKNPGGDPTGGNPAGQLSGPPDQLPPPRPAAPVHTGQTAYATFAPKSATSPPRPQSLDWTAPLAPAAAWVHAAPSVAAFSPRAAGLPTPAVQRHFTELHSGGRAYAPLDRQLSP
jgi:hypothetical protein